MKKKEKINNDISQMCYQQLKNVYTDLEIFISKYTINLSKKRIENV